MNIRKNGKRIVSINLFWNEVLIGRTITKVIYGDNGIAAIKLDNGEILFLQKESTLKLVGNIYGRLEVIEVVQLPSKQFKYKLKCKCECGNIKYYQVNDFNKGIKSCGCLRKEKWRKSYYAWKKDQERLYKWRLYK